MTFRCLRRPLVLSGILVATLLSTNTALAQKEVKTYFWDPGSIGRGQSMPFIVASDKISQVESVRFEPAEGITIGEIKETAAMEGKRCWTVDVAVAKDAPVGKRAVSLQTPEGLVRKTVTIVAQPVPFISDVQIVRSVTGYGFTQIEFTFHAEHEPGSLGEKQEINIGVTRSGFKLLPGFDYYSIKTNKIEAIDQTHSLVRVKYSPSGQALGAYWLLRVMLKDKNQHWSNEVQTKVTW